MVNRRMRYTHSHCPTVFHNKSGPLTKNRTEPQQVVKGFEGRKFSISSFQLDRHRPWQPDMHTLNHSPETEIDLRGSFASIFVFFWTLLSFWPSTSSNVFESFQVLCFCVCCEALPASVGLYHSVVCTVGSLPHGTVHRERGAVNNSPEHKHRGERERTGLN